MGLVEMLAVGVAGVGAGTINTIVGSGTLITFPTLLFFGMPPVSANITNNLGLVPGAVTGAWGYRSELHGLAPMVRRLLPMSTIGALAGAILLLVLDPSAFEAIVPVLVGLGVVLVLVGPRLSAAVARRGHDDSQWKRSGLSGAVAATGVYGGYFGAAQGVLLMGVMGALTTQGPQQLNAVKNILASSVNAVAAVVFMALAWGQIDWPVVGVLAVGATIGGWIGARVGKRLSPTALRAVIAVVGVIAIVKLVS